LIRDISTSTQRRSPQFTAHRGAGASMAAGEADRRADVVGVEERP
jgi:hypothetical protein